MSNFDDHVADIEAAADEDERARLDAYSAALARMAARLHPRPLFLPPQHERPA